AELPADFAAQCRNFADDDKLHRSLRLAAAVDPQAFFVHEIAAAATEVPWRRAFRSKDRTHAVDGDRRLHSRREVEASGVGRGFADLLAPLCHELVGATKLLSVIAKHQAALVDQAERPDIAVVARFEAARIIVLSPIDRDVFHALSE